MSLIEDEQHLANRRLVFCINSGRAGSGYLAQLLDSAVDTYAYHEPEPKMIKADLDLINQLPYEQTFQQRSRKVAGLKNKLRSLPEKSVYCETSHMFIKTFFDVAIDAFPGQIEVIALRRYLPKVLKSFIELGYFSATNQAWPRWMSSPNAATSAIPCIADDNELDQYDLSIAYLIDIEARLLRFKAMHPDIKVHEMRVENFKDIALVESFFTSLGITASQETYHLHSKPANTRKSRKKKYSGNQKVDLNYCTERIENYVDKARNLGIEIPATLAMDEITPKTSDIVKDGLVSRLQASINRKLTFRKRI